MKLILLSIWLFAGASSTLLLCLKMNKEDSGKKAIVLGDIIIILIGTIFGLISFAIISFSVVTKLFEEYEKRVIWEEDNKKGE